MQGCTVYAWHGMLPEALWSDDVRTFLDHPAASVRWPSHTAAVVEDLPTGYVGLFGIFKVTSTPAHDLRDYEVFFVPVPVPAVSGNFHWVSLSLPAILCEDLPIFYQGVFGGLGPLFGLDLSGNTILSPGGPIPVYSSMPLPQESTYRSATEFLMAESMVGVQPGAYEVPWWTAGPLAMDLIVRRDYYRLHFIQDYGGARGPCVAVYATTRFMSRGAPGIYQKVELYGVPQLDPAHWFRYEDLNYLGEVRMHERAISGEAAVRL